MPSKRPRASSRTMPEAIAMLIEDHRKVEALFKRFEKAEDDEKDRICETACKMLKAHTQLEEELFYPEAATALDDEDMIEEARIEHRVAKRLIEDLERGESRDAGFKVLSEVVMHHVEEEESELFPKLRKTDMDFESLAPRMQARKTELESALGLPPESELEPAPRRAAAPSAAARARAARARRGGPRTAAKKRRRAA